ncbi:hypothetical protein BJ166DRAFT_538896 [Pestalotiopsis sp. NC0098]|nr:hypothetical protein BJ166DRAFT_538896 [Pestalotiopsis sp. NC0098]
MSRFLLRCRVLHFFIYFVPGFGMDMIIIPRPRPQSRPESFQCSSIPAEPAFSCRDGNDVSADPVTPRQLHPMSRMSSVVDRHPDARGGFRESHRDGYSTPRFSFLSFDWIWKVCGPFQLVAAQASFL